MTSRLQLVLVVGLFTFFLACKNKMPNVYKSDFNSKNKIVFKTKIKVSVDTNFEIYYKEKSDKDFSNEKCIEFPIKKNDEYQDFVFKINDNKVQSIRIDLGINEQLNEIKFQPIMIFLNKWQFLITDIKDYFKPNIFITETKPNDFKLRILKDKIYDVYDPYFTSTKDFNKLLNTLRKND